MEITTDTLKKMLLQHFSANRFFLTVAFIISLPLLLSACSSVGSEGSLTLYSGRSKSFIDPLIEEFEKETNIKVNVKYGNSSELARLITEEGDQSPADVFLSKSPGAVGLLEQKNQLAELPENTRALVPETVQDKDGLWVGVSGRQRVLVYDTNQVEQDELPQSITELTEKKWEGNVGIAPNNGSFQDFVTAMRAELGEAETEKWLQDMAANKPVTFSDNNSIVAAVGRGEVATGLVNHYYNYKALKENPEHPGENSQFQENDPGSILIVTAAAKIKSSDNPNADKFITWMLEEEGQTAFADILEYPLASDIQPDSQLPEANFADVSGINYESLGEGIEETQRMIKESGLSDS